MDMHTKHLANILCKCAQNTTSFGERLKSKHAFTVEHLHVNRATVLTKSTHIYIYVDRKLVNFKREKILQ